jgi:DnaJ-class molecular chaperone
MFCFTCGGRGVIRRTRQLVVRIPPGLHNGGEFRIDTGEPSLGDIRVRVIVE